MYTNIHIIYIYYLHHISIYIYSYLFLNAYTLYIHMHIYIYRYGCAYVCVRLLFCCYFSAWRWPLQLSNNEVRRYNAKKVIGIYFRMIIQWLASGSLDYKLYEVQPSRPLELYGRFLYVETPVFLTITANCYLPRCPSRHLCHCCFLRGACIRRDHQSTAISPPEERPNMWWVGTPCDKTGSADLAKILPTIYSRLGLR